ncbi:MAG: NAD(P)/FAD-dependent oxidoreductase [Halarsenatibacteraceae bacterium]
MRYLVVGSGVAGISAVKEINQVKDQDVDVIVISKEKDPFYYRPRLIECLSGDISVEDIIINDREWFEKNDIELLLGKKVIDVNFDEKYVVTDDNKKFSYDKLLLAQGASSFIPPIDGVDLGGVYALRNGEDAREIYEHIESCKKAVVIGGGLLGLESAYNMTKAGLEVTVIERADHLLQRQLDNAAGDKLKLILEEKYGFNFYLDAGVEKISGNNEVEMVKLADGTEIPADLVLFSTGINPNTEIVEGKELEINRGIIVDNKMSTNISEVFAAGDVAEYNGDIYGIWAPSMEEGRVAGEVMIGQDAEFTGFVPSHTLKVAGVNVVSIGVLSESENISSRIEVDNKKTYCRIFEDNKGNLVGAIIVGEYENENAILKEIKE